MTMTEGLSLVRQYAVVRPAGPAPITKTFASTFMRDQGPLDLLARYTAHSFVNVRLIGGTGVTSRVNETSIVDTAFKSGTRSSGIRFRQDRCFFGSIGKIGQAPAPLFGDFLERPESAGSPIGKGEIIVKMKDDAV